MADPRLVPLMDLLKDGFSIEDLKDFVTRLNVDFEDLEGGVKQAKIRSLLEYLDRRKRLNELIRTGVEQRPELNWDGVAASASSAQVNPPSASLTPEIYISYAWGEPWEEIVNELDQHFQSMGINIIRDKRDLGYKASILEFMAKIGRGSYIIVVISDKYLKSANCMFELLEIARDGALRQRIFPIVLKDADIYDPGGRIQYIKYWETRFDELDAVMKTVGSANQQGIRDDIDLYARIRNAIASLIAAIKDMNTLTPEMHRDTRFGALYQAIQTAIKQDRQ